MTGVSYYGDLLTIVDVLRQDGHSARDVVEGAFVPVEPYRSSRYAIQTPISLPTNLIVIGIRADKASGVAVDRQDVIDGSDCGKSEEEEEKGNEFSGHDSAQ
ncbi:MAG TPA: hypothetical protein VF713_12220 [Thermoanaerobaculia bacterium]